MKHLPISPGLQDCQLSARLRTERMTAATLTGILAERVMRWRVGPDRFLKGGRQWSPRWQFQPLRHTDHALQLLEKTGGTFSLTQAADGSVTARVIVGGRTGTATGKSQAACTSVAIARAIGIDVPDELLEACQ